MSVIRQVATDGAPPARGHYAQAIVAGELVFCSGRLGLVPGTGALAGSDIASQTVRILDNLEAVLAASGSDLAHVLQVTVYLTDIGEFRVVNELCGTRFGEHKPARATVGAAALPGGARIEMDCIAR